MTKGQPDFTKGNIAKHIKYLAVPASVGMFFTTMYNVVDTYYAGEFSTDALAALSLSFPIFFIILAFSFGTATGVSVLVANAIGAKRNNQARKYFTQSVSYSLILSVFLTIIGILLMEKVFVFMGAEAKYLHFALDYTRVIFLGSVFFVFSFLLEFVLNALGDTRTPRNAMILGFVLNIFLDPWFLFGGFGLPALGIAGVAYATIATTAISVIYKFCKIYELGFLKGFNYRNLIPQKKIFREISEQGFPSSMNMMTVSFGIFIITYFVGVYGKEAVAAYGITTRIEQIAVLPAMGLNTAVMTLVGQNNGAKKYKRIGKILHKAIQYGSVIMLFGTAFIYFGAEGLMKFFTDDSDVIAIGVENLHIVAFLAYAYFLLFIYIAALQGIKKPAFAFWLGLYRQLLLPLVIFYLITRIWHLEIIYIWWGIFAINWSAVAITVFYARKQFAKLHINELE